MTRARLLVAYSNLTTFVPTTMEYLRSFKLHSRCDVSYLHVTHGAEIELDLNNFDAVFHSYCARFSTPGYVSASYLRALQRFRGVRLVAFQDEYEQTNALRQAIQDLQFDVVFTCLPGEGVERVYPGGVCAHIEFVPVLTGYVPAELKGRRDRWIPLSERPITIGYRGRRLTPRYGRLGFEKFEIGRRMRETCLAREIAHDIEMTEEKRIYGEAWYDFLGNCRATLGSESGSNCFDFDGSLAARYQELAGTAGRELHYEEFRKHTDPLEEFLSVGQISPRVFEAAALGTPMIMFSGRYSDIVTPGEHYIELKKDFSNIDAVLLQLHDLAALENLAGRAYDHLIASGAYDYRGFVEKVDAVVERKRAEKATPQSTGLQLPGYLTPAGKPVAEASFCEFPTAVPRDPAVLLHKQAMQQNLALTVEVARLETSYRGEIERLQHVYPAEIDRLKRAYETESEELRTQYASEAARANEIYTGEIARLNETYTAEIARLNQVYLGEIARLREVYAAETAQLRALHAEQIARTEDEHRAERAELCDAHAVEVAALHAAIAETEGLRGLGLLSHRLASKAARQMQARLAAGVKHGLASLIRRV